MEPVFVCEFTPTVKMVASRIRNYNPVRCIFVLLLGIGFFMYIMPAVIWGGFGLFEMGYFLFSIALLLYGVFFPEINAYVALRNYKKDTSGDAVYRIAFGETIEIRQGNIRASWDYSAINYVYHLKYTYELSKTKRMAVMVDPNGFTKGTFEDFKQFLRGKRPDLNIPD